MGRGLIYGVPCSQLLRLQNPVDVFVRQSLLHLVATMAINQMDILRA
ncbi:Uncharacterised protein [Vibrio cholerae]|nr:Uncharacterised protein [Vibrio cholerae]CSI62224.1 Uncharacterised protein [Vibrio cholerae]